MEHVEVRFSDYYLHAELAAQLCREFDLTEVKKRRLVVEAQTGRCETQELPGTTLELQGRGGHVYLSIMLGVPGEKCLTIKSTVPQLITAVLRSLNVPVQPFVKAVFSPVS